MIHLTSSNLTTKDIIQNVFSPLIGTFCSPLAEEICYKNNLSFGEMLQPFSKLTSDAYFRDASGAVNSVKGIRLNVCDVGWRPPQTKVARKILIETVTGIQSEKTKSKQIDANSFIDIPASEPWFEQWSEIFLSVQPPADHEYTRHFLSCLILLSSADPNIIETANDLTRSIQMMQTAVPPKMPKFFSTDALNCYVLLHDRSLGGDISLAQQAFETMKMTFGDNRCFLVQINSNETPTSNANNDPWQKYLKRQPKQTNPMDTGSAPKTPQDIAGVTAMPTTVEMSSLETPPSGIAGEEVIDHPLSPQQEQAAEAIHSKFSTSSDSLTSQIVNPNVWANETNVDAPHGIWLSAADIDNLKHFVQDFTIRSLIPFVERQIISLSDSVANKKGVSRSLLSATKRWFVTNKPGANNSQNVVVYTADSIELQTRKLGDLYFLFGNYNMAFQAYHQAKRDFNADLAWQYYAGALEMAALSAFMQGTANRKTYDYMDEAIVTYLNICKLQEFATRATLLSIACLRTAKLFGEAAKQLIRMTSIDADLPSALLLEQAAYSFLMSQPPQYRKYAFHIVLAGHRFSKCGQRKHAFRCYKQAYQVFENREWSLAEDHIQYTIGKQAVSLKKLDEASRALAHLLRPSSMQSMAQQGAFLREYIATQKTYLQQCNNGEALLEISLPKIINKSVRVLVTSPSPVASPHLVAATNININSTLDDEWKWQKLEEMVVQFASPKPIMLFKPNRSLFTCQMPAIEHPLSAQGEPIEVSFALENSIKPSITFEDINLLWSFTNGSGENFSNVNLFKTSVSNDERNAIYNIVASTFVKAIQLNEHEKKVIIIKLTPRLTGHLVIKGVAGRFSVTKDSSSLWGKLNFDTSIIKSDGPTNVEKPLQFDKKLELNILPPAPALHVNFSVIPHEVLAGEIVPVTVHLTNAGAEPLNDIFVATEDPRWILGDLNSQELPLSLLKEFRDLTNESLSRDKEMRKQHAFKLFSTANESETILHPKESKSTTIWLQAPYKKGLSTIKLLFYYGLPSNYPKAKYRLVRHTWSLNVNESLNLDINCNISNASTNELGLDVNMKNMNQVHHALMTEIYLNNLTLFCSTYSLNKKKVNYLQSPGYSRIVNNEGGLRVTESLSLRCLLDLKPAQDMHSSPLEFLRNRLSRLDIKHIEKTSQFIPDVTRLGSFLMKHETKNIGTIGQVISSEEFNNIVATPDRHMTIALTWKAIVSDNNSMQRTAFGQHFVQLRNLYETCHCPFRERIQQTNFTEHENRLSIYDFEKQLPATIDVEQNDEWSSNEQSVVTRCFLEIEEEIPLVDNLSVQA